MATTGYPYNVCCSGYGVVRRPSFRETISDVHNWLTSLGNSLEFRTLDPELDLERHTIIHLI
jgi:hypothetical protein